MGWDGGGQLVESWCTLNIFLVVEQLYTNRVSAVLCETQICIEPRNSSFIFVLFIFHGLISKFIFFYTVKVLFLLYTFLEWSTGPKIAPSLCFFLCLAMAWKTVEPVSPVLYRAMNFKQLRKYFLN